VLFELTQSSHEKMYPALSLNDVTLHDYTVHTTFEPISVMLTNDFM